MPQIKSAISGKIVSKKTADPSTTYQQKQSGYAVRIGGMYLVIEPVSYGWNIDKKAATLFARKKDALWSLDHWGRSVSIVKVRY